MSDAPRWVSAGAVLLRLLGHERSVAPMAPCGAAVECLPHPALLAPWWPQDRLPAEVIAEFGSAALADIQRTVQRMREDEQLEFPGVFARAVSAREFWRAHLRSLDGVCGLSIAIEESDATRLLAEYGDRKFALVRHVTQGIRQRPGPRASVQIVSIDEGALCTPLFEHAAVGALLRDQMGEDAADEILAAGRFDDHATAARVAAGCNLPGSGLDSDDWYPLLVEPFELDPDRRV